MVLRIIVAIGMTIFCVWQGFEAASIPSPEGRNYFPIIYIICPILLWSGMNPRGLITWPLATIFLLVRGHWFMAWIPLALVIFSVVGNEIIHKGSEKKL